MPASPELQREMLRQMQTIRRFEERASDDYHNGAIYGVVHCYIGEEAVAVGVCSALNIDDQIISTHRGHGHCIAKGTDPGAMMLELFGKEGGTCGGKGGSMHIADFKVGMLGANGVVAAGIPIAVGAAHGAKLLGEDRVVVCFFGDGAINRGPFMEGLNWAAVFNLPVLFVCEHNGFASTTHSDAVTAGPGANARAESLGVQAFTVDGNDVAAVDSLVGDLIPRIRGGSGPKFLSAHTYRLKGHTSVDPAHYRDQEYAAAQWEQDPLRRATAELRRLGLSEEQLASIDSEADAEMTVVTDAAEAAAPPALEQAFADIQDIGAPVWREQS